MGQGGTPRALLMRAAGMWAALLVLLVVSVAGALLLPGAWALLVPLGVSLAMTVLIGVFFMDLPGAGGMSRLSALAGVLFLTVLFVLTFADELTRAHPPASFDAGEE